jgi:putative spermidine/putrescine transport system substrate-binding protein
VGPNRRGAGIHSALLLLVLVLMVAGCGAPDQAGGGGDGGEGVTEAPDQAPELPEEAVTLNIIDVAGNLQLTQAAIDKYAKEHSDVVRKVNYTKAPAPELAGKVKAQQDAGRLDIDLVLTGNDGLAAGIDQDLWLKLLPNLDGHFGELQANYLEPAAAMQELAQGYGVVVTYYPSGPLLEYMPDRVPDPPTSAQELLAWAKAHPGRFMYARPANSGPGRTLLMGLPYILGDADPKDPVNGWDKTWAFLKELDAYIEYYPSGTTATMEELGEGSRDMIATTTGWDINPRVLGTVPKEAKVTTMEGFHWVTDAHYMVVPKGISEEKLAVVLDLMAYLLEPEQQAFAYDEGYFYPGPAVKDVPLSMAPEESRKAIAEYGRPEYEQLIEARPKETPLDPQDMVAAFEKWDQEVGGSKVKES